MTEWITRDTSYVCSVVLAEHTEKDTTLVCGTDIFVGDNIVYTFGANGCHYTVYGADDTIIDAREWPADASTCTRGGSLPIAIGCSRVVFGPVISIRKSATVTVGDIVDAAASLDDLYETLLQQCFSKEDTQQIVNIYLDSKGGGGGSGTPGKDGKDGATFTPFVDAAGNLSWTNNGGLVNPETVNIKGATPQKGTDYWTPADKQSIVDDVVAALPKYNGEVEDA